MRRGIAAGISRRALRDARGGAFVGPVATHFIPPGCPGHELVPHLAGERQGTGGHPAFDGDREGAEFYFRRAGFRGGRLTGTEPVLVLASKDGPARAQAEAAAAALHELGFETALAIVANNDMYPHYLTVPGARVGGRVIGVYGSATNWQPDIVDPQAVLEPLFAGWRITETGNHNFAQLSDLDVDVAMRRASRIQGSERAGEWAKVDRLVQDAAPGVPFVWENTTHVASRNVRCVMNRFTSFWDPSHTALLVEDGVGRDAAAAAGLLD